MVTGAAGFIGQHLCAELSAHDVIPVDRALHPEHDLRLSGVAESLLSEYRPEMVVHLAARVGRLFGEDDPMETVIDNAGMTSLIAQACGRHGARLAYASTSEVYGDNGEKVCQEDRGPFTLPHNAYGITKFHGEQLARHYAPEGLTVFRFSMPYGPGLPAGRGRAAIINMLHQAMYRQPIPVHRGAERSWTWIGDTVRAVRLILEETEGGTFNVGRDDNPTSMLRVAELACEIAGAPRSLIQEVDAPGNQTVVKRLSTVRLRKLGWKPEVSLEEGMRRTFDDWVQSLDREGNPVKAVAQLRRAQTARLLSG